VNHRHERAVLALERALGPSKVNTERPAREAMARDESETEVTVPRAIVYARDERDVASTLSLCNEHELAVVPRGAGTGRSGGAAVIVPSVVLDTTALRSLKSIDRDEMLAVVEPGLITGALHAQCESEGLFYAPDPQSAPWCTLGGNVAENAGGPRAYAYGVTGDYVLGMRVVTMNGVALSLGRRTAKGVTGYDMTSLMVGSEGTLGVFTELWLRVMALPESVQALLASFENTSAAARAIPMLVRSAAPARCVELLDEHCCAAIRDVDPSVLPTGVRAVLLVEVDGDEHECERRAARVGEALTSAGALEVFASRHGGDRERWWSARRVLSRALRALSAHKVSEDIVVPRTQLARMLDEVRAIAEREQLVMPTYGHAGDGNLHVNILWNDHSERPRVERAIRTLFERTVALGGTLSGEHGIGALKRDYLSLEQSPTVIHAQRAIKHALDPRGLLNPNKVFSSATHRAC
jgi:glycolate oxidase